MELTESDFTLKLQRQELLALQKGLNTLRLLQETIPNERSGFDIPSQLIVDRIRIAINSALE